MRVLITGAAGQVGRQLLRDVPDTAEAIGLSRTELDLTDAVAVERHVLTYRPSVLINVAAYTAVDRAETEVDQAFATNEAAVATLAQICAKHRIRLLHISTDFIFNGSAGRPYVADDRPDPLNVYGASKLAGERRISAQAGLDWTIIRTAWVYASAGRNFVLTMLRLFQERPVVRVVCDQIGTPTSAPTLSRCLWAAASHDAPSGVLHFTDAGVASWYDFAIAVYEEARALGLINGDVEVVPIRTAEYPTPARRPSYSVLDTTATTEGLKLPLVHWRAALRDVLKELRV